MRIYQHIRSVIDPDGAVVLDLRSGSYFSLNTVAAEIWTSLENGLSPKEITTHVGQLFNVPVSRVEPDVRRFLEDLVRRELIDVVD